MRQQVARILTIAAGLCVTAGLLRAQRSALTSLAAEADDVVVASLLETSAARDRIDYTIRIIRTMKGSSRQGDVIRASSFPQSRFERVQLRPVPDTGIFFIRRRSAGTQNRLLTANAVTIGYRRAYISLRSDSGAPVYGPSTIGNLAAEILRAIEKQSSDEMQVLSLQSFLDVDQMSIVRNTYRKWLSESDINLRRVAIGGLIHTGDVTLVTRLHDEVRRAPQSALVGAAASGLGALRSIQPALVRAVGDFVMDRGVPADMRRAAALALSEIHSRECLPYLYELLKDPDVNLREQATRGFALFVLNVRVAQPGSDAVEALDEAMNPGTRDKRTAPFATEATRRFARFDRFRDHLDETTWVEFWKTWYQAHQALLK